MPSAGEILDGLTKIADSWRILAVLWHIYLAGFAVLTLSGFRPQNRLVGAVLIPPLASVSAVAWIHGDPFNGAVFGMLSIALVAVLWNLSVRPIERAHPVWLLFGVLLASFGWAYPHFLESEPASTYFYAAPLGLIPCPSLSMAAGITMIFSGLSSRAWSLSLASAALFYGVFGSLYLGVTIDWVLAGGGVGLVVLSIRRAVGGNTRVA